MKKKSTGTIPDFSRRKPTTGGQDKPIVSGEKTHKPDPRQQQSAPTKAKNGGRRGT